MADENVIASQLEVYIAGNKISQSVLNRLQEAVVDQSTTLPHMVSLYFRDDRDFNLIDGTLFDTGKTITIKAEKASGEMVTIFEGEITALEPQFRDNMLADLVVRGYDKTHRLFREVKSNAFLNIKDSDIASRIASSAGLTPEVETTQTVYEHVFQHNQTDIAFLTERAWRIGYECFAAEGKLYFRKPPTSGSKIKLTWGTDLLSFFPSMTLAEQVNEVNVKSWDVNRKEAIVGMATKGKLYAQNGLSKDGAGYASQFGTGKKIIVNQPVISQSEADIVAQARLNEISGVFVEATGTAYRRPDVRAGQFVELVNLGERFGGTYMATSVRHVYNSDGLKSEFDVRGLRSGLLSQQMLHQEPTERWPGAVVAVVTNTDDPNNWGRVKVKYPWMDDSQESWWARVISPGAGPESGLFMLPEVGDEVMVIFEQGDFNQPYVLGGVWNGQDELPPPTGSANTGEKPLVRTWYSRTGHQISVYETGSTKKIEISTAEGHLFVLDDTNRKIELKTKSGQQLLVDDQGNSINMKTAGTVNIESTGAMSLKSNSSLKIEAAATIDIKAGAPLTLKGAVVNIN